MVYHEGTKRHEEMREELTAEGTESTEGVTEKGDEGQKRRGAKRRGLSTDFTDYTDLNAKGVKTAELGEVTEQPSAGCWMLNQRLLKPGEKTKTY